MFMYKTSEDARVRHVTVVTMQGCNNVSKIVFFWAQNKKREDARPDFRMIDCARWERKKSEFIVVEKKVCN